jgi:hypothetical protein
MWLDFVWDAFRDPPHIISPHFDSEAEKWRAAEKQKEGMKK